jgi:beta-N-acetylhexosaminidase
MPDSPEQLAELSAALSPNDAFPLLLGIDEEGGIVTRLPWDELPGADVLKHEPVDATAATFEERAAMIEASGISVNFGIVADVTDDPSSFIYDRVFGTDPAAAAERVAAAVGAEQGIVYSTIKHFPGHGAAPGDSHLTVPSTPMSIDEWRTSDALPFEAGIAAGTEFVMFGHLAYTSVDAAPASLSSTWHATLREELGFEGVTITDDMLMLQHTELPEFADPYENAIRAIAAGTDMLLYVLPADPADVDIDLDALVGAIATAVTEGRIGADAIDASVTRLLTLRAALGSLASTSG